MNLLIWAVNMRSMILSLQPLVDRSATSSLLHLNQCPLAPPPPPPNTPLISVCFGYRPIYSWMHLGVVKSGF